MFLHTVSKEKSSMTRPVPFGGGFDEREAEEADRMEVWCSRFDDPGPDYNVFRLVKDDMVIAERRVVGY